MKGSVSGNDIIEGWMVTGRQTCVLVKLQVESASCMPTITYSESSLVIDVVNKNGDTAKLTLNADTDLDREILTRKPFFNFSSNEVIIILPHDMVIGV